MVLEVPPFMIVEAMHLRTDVGEAEAMALSARRGFGIAPDRIELAHHVAAIEGVNAAGPGRENGVVGLESRIHPRIIGPTRPVAMGRDPRTVDIDHSPHRHAARAVHLYGEMLVVELVRSVLGFRYL